MSYENKMETQPANSSTEEAKGETLSWQKWEAELRRNYAPKFEPNAVCRGFDTGSGNEHPWQFSGYDEKTGIVTVVTRPEGETNTHYQKQEIPLLEFHMLNSQNAPKEMRVPLSSLVETWDARSCKPFRIGIESDLEDAPYDYLKGNPKTRDALLGTPVSLEEGKALVAEMQDALLEDTGRNEEEYLNGLDKERQALARRSKANREMLFSQEAEEELREAA